MAGGSTQWRGRSVISKVVSLLDAFTPDAPELSLADMARITGLPVSTAYRLASELVTWGGLERADGGTGYRVGARMAELGSLAPRSTDLRDVAAPFMQDLCVATRESVHLAVLDGRHAVYLHTTAPGGVAPADSGPRLPLHATAAGKVLLAHAPDQLVSDLVVAGLRRYTQHTIVDPDRLRQELSEVRETGVGYERDEMITDLRSAAAPIVDATGAVVAALTVVQRSGRDADVCRLGPAVRTAATSVSRSLRLPPVPRGELPERS